ncbi:MAG: MBL fold metallo-hydrolase [Desulfurococcaceae archaeon]
MRIIIVSNDKAKKPDLQAKHSFSVYIERSNETYLFDLGVDPGVLEHNVNVLDIGVDIVDYVIVSHEHLPHYGGYKYLSSESPYTTVYIPFSSSESLGRVFKTHGLKPVEVTKWTKLSEGVYITKPYYGPPYEHFLLFELGDHLIVLTGCLHPGVAVLKDISNTMGKKIKGVIGGFHLKNAPERIVEAAVDQLVENVKPEFISPLHCAGELFTRKLKERREIDIVELQAGDELSI